MATIMATTTKISKESTFKKPAKTVSLKEDITETVWSNFLIMRMTLMTFLKKELMLVMSMKTILMISLSWLTQSIKACFSLKFNSKIISTIQKIFLMAMLVILLRCPKEELLKKDLITMLLGKNGTKKVPNHLLPKQISRKKTGTKLTKFQKCQLLNTLKQIQM